MEERRQTGVYASCCYHENSLQDITAWLHDHNDVIPNPVPIEHLHTTVVYSRADFEIPKKAIEHFNGIIDEFKFFPSGFALLGKQEDEKKALVMLLEAEPLEVLHDFLLENGATHGFDDYIPHVTLSYEADKDFDTSPIKPPNFYLRPAKINFAPLDLNWSLQDDVIVL